MKRDLDVRDLSTIQGENTFAFDDERASEFSPSNSRGLGGQKQGEKRRGARLGKDDGWDGRWLRRGYLVHRQ